MAAYFRGSEGKLRVYPFLTSEGSGPAFLRCYAGRRNTLARKLSRGLRHVQSRSFQGSNCGY